MTATDRDRETARKLWRAARYADPVDAPEVEDVIADALAAERARVLAPVLALAEELDREGVVQLFHGPDNANKYITARIRRAAQDGAE